MTVLAADLPFAGRDAGPGWLVRGRWWLLFAAVVVLLMAAGPELAPNDPERGNMRLRLLAPSLDYPLGTDAAGRCLFSRLLAAFQVTPVAAAVAAGASLVLGALVGLGAALAGGIADRIAMRVVDGILALPIVAVALVLSGIFGLGLRSVVIAIVALHWADYARLLRNLVVAEQGKLHVLAATALGCRPAAIVGRHILPAALPALCVLFAWSLSWAVLTFAGLSFIGLGAAPGTPEFGLMLAEARDHMRTHPHLILVPGIAVMALVIGLNLLSDRVRARLPGRLR
ncbi:MAG: ABC transporter permease [Alphaproteobacteria bacterium]